MDSTSEPDEAVDFQFCGIHSGAKPFGDTHGLEHDDPTLACPAEHDGAKGGLENECSFAEHPFGQTVELGHGSSTIPGLSSGDESAASRPAEPTVEQEDSSIDVRGSFSGARTDLGSRREALAIRGGVHIIGVLRGSLGTSQASAHVSERDIPSFKSAFSCVRVWHWQYKEAYQEAENYNCHKSNLPPAFYVKYLSKSAHMH